MNEEKESINVDMSKVDVAVRFLKNQNVSRTDKERKVTFLKSKGLNGDEISVALEKAGDVDNDDHVESDDGWHFFDYLKGIVLGAGILSAANYSYKAYILPYVAHEMKDDRRIETLTESMQCVQDDIKQHTYELNGTLKHIQALLEEQHKLIANINSSSAQTSIDSTNLTALKTELTTLKSMMLSKRQFPPAPFSAPASTEIPAWQQVDKSTVTDKTDETQETDEIKIQ